MYRVSSKGNPYHDARGRFARKDGMMDEASAIESGLLIKDDNGKTIEDKRTVMWSSFGEQKDVRKLNAKQAEKVDKETTKSHLEDGERFYHKQSIQREKHARAVSVYTVPKGTPRSQRKGLLAEARKEFIKENRPAINRGGKVKALVRGNTIAYQVVESERLSKKTAKPGRSVTVNTSTSMKNFYGYTVEFTKGNSDVRSCKKNTTMAEAKDHLNKFCMKHKKSLGEANVCMKVWRNEKDNRLFYMPSYFFDSQADAEAFAANHPGARVVNHDDGSQA